MAVKKNHEALLKHLKKRIYSLQQKEERNRNKVRAALKKIRTLGKSYKSKLKTEMRAMKGKVAQARSLAYAKMADDLETHVLKSIEAKARAVVAAVAKIEKKHASRLKKVVVKSNGKKAKRKKSNKHATIAKSKTR